MFPAPAGHTFKLYVVVAFTFFLLGLGAIPSLHPASAYPVIRILPTQPSFASEALDLISIRAILETGNSVDMIRITLDDGMAVEKVYEFDIDGKVIRADAGLSDAYCDARFRSDGYSIGPSVVDCNVVLDRSILAAGTHQIKSELVTEIGIFADDSELTLLASGR